MQTRTKLATGGAVLALAGAAGFTAPAFAVDFLGAPLWESYPGQYRYYDPAPPGPAWYYDPYTGRYYRRF